ncbi:MAG: S8 family serine peptidase [Candidatus Kapabacteria bacterium]|nr:S8 family serine peptidase [Candidatus Kapabacteria bacterium]
MKFIISILLLSVASNFSLWSQNRFHTSKNSFQLQPSTMVGILVKGNSERLEEEIRKHNGTITAISGDIISAQIPAGSVIAFSKSPYVLQFECGVRYYPANEQTKVHSRTDKVHQGSSPLTSGRTGKGVIVGIIDTGIDIFHPEFMKRNQPNQTRILAIWDQNDTLGDFKPQGFNYGTEWSKEQIQATINGDSIVRHRDFNFSSHGTHVAGTAAGLSGNAPDADIVVVGLDWDGTTSLTDASLYMVKKSIEFGKPIVINASLGSHEVPHDGSDLSTQFIDSLIAQHPQVAYVVAAGNEGSSPIHWEVDLTDSVQMTYTQFGSMSSYFEMHPNENLRIQFRLDSIHTGNGTTTIHTLNNSQEFEYSNLLADSLTSFVFTNVTNDTILTVDMVATLLGNKKELLVSSRYRSARHNFGILVKGKEKLHAWHWGNWLWQDGRDLGIKGYVPTNSYYSLRAPGTGKNVLTVGAYVNIGEYINIKGDTLGRGLKPGSRANFSSIGPTSDERMKPEISAPGQNVMSAYPVNSPVRNANRMVGDSITVVNSGTSMATPVVTGIVATYFEGFPNATFSDIKKRVIASANQDSFALMNGDLPNNFWGFGKIDAFGFHTLNITSVQQFPITVSRSTVSSLGNKSLLVTIALPTAGNFECEFFDVYGRLLQSIPLQNSYVGEYTFSLPLDYIGLVVMRVKVGKEIITSSVGINY